MSKRDTGGLSALFAAKHKLITFDYPTPGPCPACKQIHWLANCKHPNKEKKQREIIATKKARKAASRKNKGASATLANIKSDSPSTALTLTNNGGSANVTNNGDFSYMHRISALIRVGANDKKIVGTVILNCRQSLGLLHQQHFLRNLKLIKPMVTNGIVP